MSQASSSVMRGGGGDDREGEGNGVGVMPRMRVHPRTWEGLEHALDALYVVVAGPTIYQQSRMRAARRARPETMCPRERNRRRTWGRSTGRLAGGGGGVRSPRGGH